MVDFTRSPRELELEARTKQFIREVVIPFESDPRLAHGVPDELVREMRVQAREAGLLAPQAPVEWGGYGLDHRETATVLRAAGYSLLGPLAMNCAAPDEGNIHLLDRVATPAQKERFLRPLAAGTIRSSFFMTEPDGGAGSDPDMMRTEATRDGDHWVVNGRKWFITGADGADYCIIMARMPDGAATMFLSDMQREGIVLERNMDAMDRCFSGGHGVLRFDDHPPGHIVGIAEHVVDTGDSVFQQCAAKGVMKAVEQQPLPCIPQLVTGSALVHPPHFPHLRFESLNTLRRYSDPLLPVQSKALELAFPDPPCTALSGVHLQSQMLPDPVLYGGQRTFRCRLTAYVDIAVIGISAIAVLPPVQFLIKCIQIDIGQQWR